MTGAAPHIAIIGAGIAGLSTALRLVHTGARVSVFEAAATPGGKMRTVPSVAGPVDAGPTVLTMRHVFDALFADTGSALENHVTLIKEHLLARHFWLDGSTLDLTRDPQENADNIATAFGAQAASDFKAFDNRTQRLFDAFDAPMMRTAAPSLGALTGQVLRNPALLRAMAPHKTLLSSLRAQFSDPRLSQLFARYATYVGGMPQASPALLALIWQSEAQGVWHVRGGMHKLAIAIADRAAALGAVFHYNTPVKRIEMQDGRPRALETATGRIQIDAVVFNGDPRALREGLLGEASRHALTDKGTKKRSLSAFVHSFAAKPAGIDLAGHNVFFGNTPEGEFAPLARGEMPQDPTLYICAQDRFGGAEPDGRPERFEIIMNGAPTRDCAHPSEQEITQCQTLVFDRLRTHGLTFTPTPRPQTLTTPAGFGQMFPASNGSLYGRSPHGMMAALQRPTVRSRITGLYLAGGGVHPGAGVPMATLCAAHAAEAIMTDLNLTSTSRPRAMDGGTSTGCLTMAPAQSRSLPS